MQQSVIREWKLKFVALGGLCAPMLMAAILVSPVFAQEGGSQDRQEGTAQTERATKLELRADTFTAGAQINGVPGKQVKRLILLNAPTGISVGGTANSIRFPNEFLSFQEVREGLSALAGEAEVQAEVRTDDADTGFSIVEVTARGKPGAVIPNGVIAEVMFAVSDQAPDGAIIPLENRPSAFTADEPPQPVRAVVGSEDTIEISKTALFSCFFYMH